MRLYQVSAGDLVPVPAGRLNNEGEIEAWLAKQPELLGLDLLIIGQQVATDFGGRIDLLGIDAEGNLVIIELKRGRTPREVIAQILDYASWVSTLTPRRVYDIAEASGKGTLDARFIARFGEPPPQALNSKHSMVIVATAFDASSHRIVRYLSEIHGLEINAAFFSVFENQGQILVGANWLLDQTEVESRAEKRNEAPWSGLWYVNVGEGPNRSWEDMRNYGFIAAGGGERWSGPLAKLRRGEPIVAYQSGAGYVGYGTVVSEREMARDFVTASGPLFEQALKQPNLAQDRDSAERAMYVVGVNWEKTFPIGEAKWSDGLFANQNVVCKLRDKKTISFLSDQFGIDAAG